MIELISTGLIYRNPKPFLRSIHAWHPTLVQLDNGDLLAAYDLAEAVEAVDYHTYLSRSTDGGASWSEPIRRRCTSGSPTCSVSRMATCSPPSGAAKIAFTTSAGCGFAWVSALVEQAFLPLVQGG